jgi:ribonuclease P protein component
MTKILTLKKRRDFLRVAQDHHIATYNVVVQATRSLCNDDFIRVGYTATKKIGNAVIRAKSKRRMRAIARMVSSYLLKDVDYVFIARISTANCDFNDLSRDAIYAIKRINKNFIPTQNDDKK